MQTAMPHVQPISPFIIFVTFVDYQLLLLMTQIYREKTGEILLFLFNKL